MSDLNSTKTRDELVTELSVAEASYDWAKVSELEAAIKTLDKKWTEHKVEMSEATQKVDKEKAMKIEDLKNMLQGTPENKEKNADTIVEQAKTRLQETIDRYMNKFKDLKNASESEKDVIKKQLEDMKAELKKEKDTYEKVKKDFFAPATTTFEKFTDEDLKKISPRMVRYATREGKLFNQPKLTKMKTLRRNITMKTLIKKFDTIGNNPKDGVRFIMGFEKARFLRYTWAKITTALDKAWSAMGMRMSPQEFNAKVSAGKNNMFAILDADTGDEKTKDEIKVIDAIKNRINYYEYAYKKERATEWLAPSIAEDKNTKKEGKIIKMDTSSYEVKAAA